jgi:hypothetical protein
MSLVDNFLFRREKKILAWLEERSFEIRPDEWSAKRQ